MEISVCRLLQSHCTTLEFQTRTLGRAESKGERAERKEGTGGRREGEAKGRGEGGGGEEGAAS